MTSLDELERDIDACVQLIAARAPSPKPAWTDPPRTVPVKVADRLERWAAERSATMARREQLRRQNETRLMSECTFRPRLDKNTAATTTSDEPVHERLRRRQLQAAAEIEARRRQQSRLDPAEFTFRPKINARSRAMLDDRLPIYERTNELQRAAISRRASLKAQFDQEVRAELTFRPEINRTSAHLMRRRRHQEQVGAVPAPRTPVAAPSEYDDELRFRPEINDVSRRLVQQLQVANRLPVDFVQRQMTLMRQRQTSLLRRQPSPSPPRPKGNADAILRNNAPCDGSTQDVFVRMSKGDWERRHQKQERVGDVAPGDESSSP